MALLMQLGREGNSDALQRRHSDESSRVSEHAGPPTCLGQSHLLCVRGGNVRMGVCVVGTWLMVVVQVAQLAAACP